MKPLKILLIYDCLYPASLGGVEYRNFCLAKALAANGHQVTLAGWGAQPAEVLPQGVAMLQLPFAQKLHDTNGKRSLMPTLRFAAAMLRLDLRPYDIIEAANIPYLHLFPLALRCLLARKPLMVSWYEFFGSYWRHYKDTATAWLYQMIEYMSAQIGTRVNASCEQTRQKLAAARWRKEPQPPLLPCGVWLEDIQSVQQRPAINSPRLLYAGRLIPEKRLDLLLHAMALMPANSDAPPLLGIVGDGTERDTLEQLARSLKLGDRVRFYGRLPAIEDMWHMLAHAELAVQPSQREGFGLFPLEALALGVPVIYCAAAENAIGDVVRHESEGLCSAPTPKALAETIQILLNNPELRAAYSKRCLARAQLYDWPMVAKQTESLFYEMI